MKQSFLNKIRLRRHGCRDSFSKGECYELGRYVREDEELAWAFYLQAEEEGDSRAYAGLGRIFERREEFDQALSYYWEGVYRRDRIAKDCLLQLVLSGQVNIICITEMYRIGLLFERDENWLEAKRWYEMAIEQPFSGEMDREDMISYYSSMYQLGMLCEIDRFFEKQIVIRRNIPEAFRWYQRATIAGSAEALNALVSMISEEPEAAFCIAQLYELEEGFPTKNLERAIAYYQEACDLGNRDAAFRLGEIYEGTEGIEEDIQQVKRYYLIAARLKHTGALQKLEALADQLQDHQLQYELGKVCYQIFSDKKSALSWFRKSLKGENPNTEPLLQNLSSTDAEFAYLVAESYREEHIDIAIHYYILAVKKNYEKAKQALENLAEEGQGYPEAQYGLAYHYYHRRNNILEAAKWSMKAAEQDHEAAAYYLDNTTFTVKVCLEIAHRYEAGEWVSKNMLQAIKYYQRASDLGDSEAAFRLGEIYEGTEEIEADIQKVKHYYIIAARLKHLEALQKLEGLAEQHQDDQLQYELGEIYYQVFQNKSAAITWYHRSDKEGNSGAQLQIENLSTTDPEFAYLAGEIYREEAVVTAIHYYILAVKRNYEEARQALETLAKERYPEAQYGLAYHYYHRQGELLEAAKWCMKAAEQEHTAAWSYLNQTNFGAKIFFEIAQLYDLGEFVEKDQGRSVLFYTKASELNHQGASFRLGQLLQLTDEDVYSTDEDAMTFDAYLRAASNGNRESLVPLERLAEFMPPDKQIALGHIYRDTFHDSLKASFWYRSAGKTGTHNTQRLLSTLNK